MLDRHTQLSEAITSAITAQVATLKVNSPKRFEDLTVRAYCSAAYRARAVVLQSSKTRTEQ